MTDAPSSRKTRAIMFSDIQGYSKLMGQDETHALALLDEHSAVLRPIIERHGGQVVKLIGDSVLASYESSADAVLASIEVQQALARRNEQVVPRDQIRVRIGVHVGDVVLRDNDAFGDGVNIAARLEPLAEPGGIAISQTVHDMVRALPEIRTESMGVRELKNISEPVHLYRVLFEGAPSGVPAPSALASMPLETIERKAQRLEQVLAHPAATRLMVREQWKLSRQERKQQRRERRAGRDGNRSKAEGAAYAGFALVLAGIALLNAQELWWLLFVAMGPAMNAARILGRPSAPEPQPLPEGEKVIAPQPTLSSRQVTAADAAESAKLDALCNRLRADLASGPSIAREVIRDPEKTVESLRKSCHQLLERSASLKALGSDGEDHRLDDERRSLTQRIAAEADAIARERLQAALGSLEGQIRQRAEMRRLASRMDAEYTRLYYTLQNLHTQVLRVRSVDLASAETGLRQTTEQLAAEMDAVAEALEELNRHDTEAPAPIADVSGGSDAGRQSSRVRS